MNLRTRAVPAFLTALALSGSILAVSPSTAAEDLCFGRPGTSIPPNESGAIHGTTGNDIILGTDGDDTIYGQGGNDRICSGSGHDTISGMEGRDRIDGGSGGDTIAGDSDDDFDLNGGAGSDVVDGGDGHDVIRGGNGDDHLTGDSLDAPTPGDDLIDGGPSSDGGGDWVYFFYRVGVDLPSGEAFGPAEGHDILKNLENVYGSLQDDTIVGDSNSNYLLGWEGNDIIWAKGGDDVVDGMGGDDGLFGGDGSQDWVVNFWAFNPVTVDLKAGQMRSQAEMSEPPEGPVPEPEVDRLNGLELVAGSAHDDTLLGDSGTNYLAGFGGEDEINGRGGIDIGTFYNAVDANLAAGTTANGSPLLPEDENVPEEDVDALENLEGLWGSPASDTLRGHDNRNYLFGDRGDDQLFGLDGNDHLSGDGGTDDVAGGRASDRCLQAETKVGCEGSTPLKGDSFILYAAGVARPEVTESREIPSVIPPRRYK